MAYYLVENFKGGIDLRNHPMASIPGTLREAKNVHVTEGGEIEKRKAFVRQFWDADTDPVNILLSKTFGLVELNDTLFVLQDNGVTNGSSGNWGTGSTTISTPYGDVTLNRQLLTGSALDAGVPGAGALDTLLDWDVFDGKLYIVASDAAASNTVQHFYNGARVTSLNAEGNALLCTKVRTFKDRIYGIQDTGIYFCAIGDPTDWGTTAAPNYAGFIPTSGASSEGENLTGLEIYYDALAIFSRSGIQIWDMAANPTNHALRQVIRSSGLIGSASPLQYGSGDVLYLSASGIRSLRARDSSNVGAVGDIGSPIDTLVKDKLRAGFTTVSNAARSFLDPQTGRAWMSLGDEILVFSQYPGMKVNAWTRYIAETPTGAFTVSDLVSARDVMFVRSTDDEIFLLGGTDDATYDETEALVDLPYLVFDDPAGQKRMKGLDFVGDRSWHVSFNENPVHPMWTPIANLYGSTINANRIGMQAFTASIALRFRSAENRRATLSQTMIHYDLAKRE